MIRGDDLDERVEGVVGAEGLVGGRDGGVDHRARVDEITEVDDPRYPVRVVAIGKQVPGVDVAVDRRRGHELERRRDHGVVPVEPALDERAAICPDVGEFRPELGQSRDVPEDGALRQGMREAGERLIEACNSDADRATGGRGDRSRRERCPVDQA